MQVVRQSQLTQVLNRLRALAPNVRIDGINEESRAVWAGYKQVIRARRRPTFAQQFVNSLLGPEVRRGN